MQIRVALAAAGLATVAGASAAGAATTRAVAIANFAFVPTPLNAVPGDTVRWTNKDSAPHTVVNGAFFSSPTLGTGRVFTTKLVGAGGYRYRCTIHPSMVGTVAVKPVAPTTAVHGRPVTVKLASAAVTGLRYTATIKKGAATVATLTAGTGKVSVVFTPATAGAYTVTATTAKAASKTAPSPAVRITVS